MFTIPPTVVDSIKKLIEKDGKTTYKDLAVVRLYTADFEGKWLYSNLCGILTLSYDRKVGAPFFHLYDVETYEVLFENELYYNFINSYDKLQDAFYAYELPQGYIGFLFSDDATAEKFKKSVTQFNKKKEEKELKKIIKEKWQKKEGIFSKITNFFTGGGKAEKTTQVISKPTNVQQNLSIKFDFDKGKFDLQSLSPEMKKIFKKAGIEKKDLLDKDFAPVLFEKILSELNRDAEVAPQEETKQAETSLKTNTVVENKNVPPPPNINIPPPPNLNIPKPPALNLAAPPKIDVNPSSIQGESKPAENKPAPPKAGGRDDLLAQIKNPGVKLKPVVPNDKKDDKQLLQVKINQDVEESLTLTLAKAILERRKQITKNDQSSSEESPWTDSD